MGGGPERQGTPLSYGELGVLRGPRGVSTELMMGVEHPDLYGGKPTNIPLLVQGQEDVDSLLQGKPPTQRQYEIAVRRAIERVKAGKAMPMFQTREEAAQGEAKRHRMLDIIEQSRRD